MKKSKSELFDEKAHKFYLETGYLPNGKDDPRGIHTREERQKKWEEWNKELK